MKTSIGLNVAKLLSGKVVAQILSMVVLPILTRLFFPAQFGMLQIFSSIAAMLLSIVCLKYELSIPLGRDDQETIASLALSGLSALGVALLVLAVVVVGKAEIAARFHIPDLQHFLWLLPLAVFAGGIGTALGSWAAYTSQFGVLAWTEVSTALVDKLLPLCWGILIGASATGLFVGRISSISLSIGVLLFLTRHSLSVQVTHARLNFGQLWTVARRHKKFPLLSSWSSLLNAISIQLPSLLFGAYFSSTIVGYYALGYNAINFPMVMLRDSIAQVFFPIAAREYQELGSVTHVIKTFFLRLVQIGVFPVVIVSVWGSTLFKVVFGPRWVEAGIYAQILAVWSFFGFLNAPLRVFEIVYRQEIDLFINILLLTSRTIGLWLGLIFTSPRVALGIFVVISVGILGGSVVVKLRLAHVPIFWAIKILIQYLLLACVLIFPVQLIAWSVNDSRIVLGALGLATVGYGLALFMIDHSFREFVFTILSRVGINR